MTAKQQFAMINDKETEWFCIFTQGEPHNSDSTSWYSYKGDEPSAFDLIG